MRCSNESEVKTESAHGVDWSKNGGGVPCPLVERGGVLLKESAAPQRTATMEYVLFISMLRNYSRAEGALSEG